MKRTGFAQKMPRREPTQSTYTPRPREVAVARPDAVARCSAPVQKTERWESVPWRKAVADLPCVLCGKVGETQCAHRNEGKGMGMKTDDCLTAALCVACHSEIDQGPGLTRDQRRERLDRAILMTVQALARAGRLRTVEQKA